MEVLSIQLLCDTISVPTGLVFQDTVCDINGLFVERGNLVLTLHPRCRDLCQRKKRIQPHVRNP